MLTSTELTHRHATPTELVTEWPRIREALLRIKRGQGHHGTWVPEHVRAAIVEGRAELWVAVDLNGKHHGFAVTQVIVDPFLHCPMALFVWMAAKYEGAPRGAGREMEEMLERVAAERGLCYLEALITSDTLRQNLAARGWSTELYVIRKPVGGDHGRV